MRRPTRLSADLWISRGVREKLQGKHHLEAWEVEQAVFDDPDRFMVRKGDVYAIFGRTFAGRYLLCLVRRLRLDTVATHKTDDSVAILRLITAREMNDAQRQRYQAQRDRRS